MSNQTKRPQYEIDYSLTVASIDKEEAAAHKAFNAEIDAHPEWSDEFCDERYEATRAEFNAKRAAAKSVYRAAYLAAGNTI